MDYKVQLLSFLFSFLFGVFFYFTSLFNHKMIQNQPILFKYIITILYVLVISLLYVLLMYKVNYGVIHIYFLMVLFLGFYCGFLYRKKFIFFFKEKRKNRIKGKMM